jgi:glycosyltransferase involved in cell wall biosynthesis
MTSLPVLHLFANYKWTGPADPAIRSAARLRSLMMDVRFAQGSFMHRGGEHRVADELWRWRIPVVTGLELRKHFHIPSLLRDVKTLRAMIRRDRYRIVHCHLPSDHLLAAIACRGLSSPPKIVRTLYEPDPPARGWRERFAFGRTSAVIAPTEKARDGVVQRFDLAPNIVLHVDPVTEDRQLEGPTMRDEWQVDATNLVVGITARIQPHRRFDLLWATARAVVDHVPQARFVLLGRGNEQDTAEQVQQPVARLGLQRHVLLPGYQKGPDYARALRSLDAFLFLVPGSDGTCRAVCDAMAFGLPVVSTSRGILPELLAERRPGEVPGFAVAESPSALSSALLRLLRDDELRDGCGRAALQRARLDMNPHTAAQRTRSLYGQILGEPS